MVIAIGVIGGIKVNEGYELYKEAIEKVPLEDKVAEIKNKENYTTIEELPKMYIKAVIAAEDHRFYTHKGVDVISIISAIWKFSFVS